MTVQAVLLDADGVVILPDRFADYLRREHGITRESTRDFFGGVFHECLLGRADLKEVIAPYLLRWGWKSSVEAFLDCWFSQEDAVDARVLAMIAKLRDKGLPCYLATNQEKYRLAYLKTKMGFDTIFDGVFASAELGYLKSDARYYASVTAMLGLPREALLFWDDSPDNVEIARAYGWNAEYYTGFDDFQRLLAAKLKRR